MVLLRAAVASLVLLVAACSVGEVPSGGGATDGGVDAVAQAAKFTTTIKPLIDQKGCLTGANCHSSGTNPKLTAYADLDARYKMPPGASNILVTKGVHQTLASYFDETQKKTIADWIDGK